jgi:soluble lytic murein transglycosylase-like protein
MVACLTSPVRDALPGEGLPFQLRVGAIGIAESGMRENIMSKAGAIGPMQLMPITIKELQTAKDVPLECRPPKQGWEAKAQTFKYGIKWGACYLKVLEKRGFTGIEQLIAYNAGPSRAIKWRQTGRMPRETVAYVKRVGDIEYKCWKELGQ